MSIPIYWPDEFAFIRFNNVIYKSATPAIGKVSEFAERDGRPHGKIISTTPSNVDTPEGEFCKSLIDSACQFTEQMYDWPREKIKDYITANASNDFLYIKYTWRQLGLDEEWYQKQCRDLLHDWLIIRREIDLEWTKSSDNSVFKEEELDLLSNFIKTPVANKIIEVTRVIEETAEIRKIPYNFVCYEELDKDKAYFIGCDVAGGLDKDFSTIVFCDPKQDFKPVAIFKNNIINIRQFADLLICIVKEHFKNAVLFIENNNYGKGVIDICIDYISKSLYYEYKIQDKDKTVSNPAKVTGSISYGINTNTGTRELMIDVLREIITDNPSYVVAAEIYDDIKGLVYNKRGKIEHDRGMHDDVLFGWLMVQYAVRFGNNITKFLRNKDSLKNESNTVSLLNGAKSEMAKANDPVFNKGMDVDFKELIRLVAQGESIDAVKQELINRAAKTKGKRVETTVNQSTLQTVLSKGR